MKNKIHRTQRLCIAFVILFTLYYHCPFIDKEKTIDNIREHSFFRRGGWAEGIQGRVINFLPAQKGRVSINLTQQRGGSL